MNKSQKFNTIIQQISLKCDKTVGILDEFYSKENEAWLELNSLNGDRSNHIMLCYKKYPGQEKGIINFSTNENCSIVYNSGQLEFELLNQKLNKRERFTFSAPLEKKANIPIQYYDSLESFHRLIETNIHI